MSTMIRGANYCHHADTGPSKLLWKDCPWDDIGFSVEGVKFEDNFVNTPSLSTTAVTGKYACFADTGGTILGASTALGGITLTVDADDNQACEISAGGATCESVNFIDPAGGTQPYDIWFECRFELSAVVGNCFIGFMENETPDGDHITDSGALQDIGLIGFSTLEATPTILNFTYKKASQTVQVPITTVDTMVAATAGNYGFNYISSNPTSRKISVYADNVMNTTGVTKANIEAATFPDNVLMTPTCAIKNVTDITALTLYWWRFAMVKK